MQGDSKGQTDVVGRAIMRHDEADDMTDGAPALTGGVDSIFRTADVVGDAWSWLVLREAVLYDVTRFAELQVRLGCRASPSLACGFSQRVAGGLSSSNATAEYQLTAAGHDFLGCLLVAMRWGDHWHFGADARPQRGHPPRLWPGPRRGAPVRAVPRGCSAGNVAADRAGSVSAPRDRTGGPEPAATGAGAAQAEQGVLHRTDAGCHRRLVERPGDPGVLLRHPPVRRLPAPPRHRPNILSGRLRRLVGRGILAKVEYEASGRSGTSTGSRSEASTSTTSPSPC